MKTSKKALCAALAAALILSAMPIPAQAAESPSEKEEVIYAMTGTDGDVKTVYAVNSFKKGSVTDYGNYSDVKMLTTNDAIHQSGDKITFQGSADRTYYQGTLKDKEIPWKISIKYFLNGTEIPADQLAGKSGSLEIHFQVTKNDDCKNNFYKNYALQATFTLDTEKCNNISAGDATQANEGSKKLLTYILLPNRGINTSIKADVTDYEQDAVTINGIKLNLDVKVNSKEVKDNINKLLNGTETLNTGANRLKDGSQKVTNGTLQLKDNTSALSNGAGRLSNGAASLQAGVGTMQAGFAELEANSDKLVNGSDQVKNALAKMKAALNGASAESKDISELTQASGKIKEGIGQLESGAAALQQSISFARYKATMAKNGLNIDTLRSGNVSAINSISNQIGVLSAELAKIQSVPKYAAQAAQLKTQITSLQSTVILLKGDVASINGTEAYLDRLSKAAGQLSAGLQTLSAQYEKFDSAISTLADMLGNAAVNVSKLASGVTQLSDQYSELDSGIGAYTNGVAKLALGCTQMKAGIDVLAEGTNTLSSGSKKLYDGTAALYSGTSTLCNGSKELSSGTDTLHQKAADAETQVSSKVGNLLSGIENDSDNSKTASFVSDKNTDVDSVQFVIKTDAVKKPEKEKTDVSKTKSLNFWQKFLKLFGLYKD
jgi:putative membrane protein